MRITFPSEKKRLGALRVHFPGNIIELDSAGAPTLHPYDSTVRFISAQSLEDALRSMTVVVAIKDERRSTLRGVLAGIPGQCQVVVLSASAATPIDRFGLEKEIVSEFNDATGRRVLHLNQHDPELAKAIQATGLDEITDDTGIVKPGKGEAMLAGMMIADSNGSDSVGFIDADNYVPGAVNEYVRIFAATMTVAQSDFTMGRISWQSKPKVENGELVFNRWGRTTAASNRILNEVLSHYLGEGSRVISTANAGEHVISMELARTMRMYGGYGAETGEIVDMMEQFGGIIAPPDGLTLPGCVDIVQTETINPHFHEDKGEDHVEAMRAISLATITASPICPPSVKAAYQTTTPPPTRYPSLASLGTKIDIERITSLGLES